MDPRFRQTPPFGRIPLNGGAPLSLWQKLVAVIVGGAMFVLALMFSVVLFAAVVAVGVVVWGWLWWKTRAVRRQMREMAGNAPPRPGQADGGLVIEGEVIREVRTEEEPPRP
ncbi:hypothetical protein E6C76_10565 [Pseudothauera nasutitermitis]|uniref:Uncharacterized protein n=1 Tax=Pseudothauera nasutitermitis TaxID=2565930 RepID=A0A4S4AWT1_9RHOO|nr:hypothetical protein [Pseudothauera nasutitermitis]THF64503.1 hypothetical protein E6C76_10565 [Pseudothauera nasutitermitis]